MPPHEGTLFHLVPRNKEALDALAEPGNARFVSTSANGDLGLEVGFHVPSLSRGHIITELGRDADLSLPKSSSAVQVAFEVHPVTSVVMLYVRTKRSWSVTVEECPKRSESESSKDSDDEYGKYDNHDKHDEDWKDKQLVAKSGDCAIIYGTEYLLNVASYEFRLVWRAGEGPDKTTSLEKLTMAGYKDSMARYDPLTQPSWPETRAPCQTPKELVLQEARSSRVQLNGADSPKPVHVYRSVEAATGYFIAVKEVLLKEFGLDMEKGRARVHKEVKLLEKLSHDHIIKFLGTQDLDTETPRIFMPLCDGNLHDLVRKHICKERERLCDQVLFQMLSALDYLAFHGLCHRNVCPRNILYEKLDGDTYRFVLSDFSLVEQSGTTTERAGSSFYSAPEVFRKKPQTSKADVWSLAVIIAVMHHDLSMTPCVYDTICDLRDSNGESDDDSDDYEAYPTAKKHFADVRRWAAWLQLAPMARLRPGNRASAAQALVALFGGQGLTTPASQVPATPWEADGSYLRRAAHAFVRLGPQSWKRFRVMEPLTSDSQLPRFLQRDRLRPRGENAGESDGDSICTACG